MYIAPNSDVRILQNIRVDPEYDNTIYFGNENAQRTYFMGKTKHTLTEQYYVRIEDGIIKVEIPIGSLVDCNYMMFKNTSFENKWFYAFIDKVEYVNNVTTRVHFTIDVMQTWYFDYDLAYSLVEREHVRDDTVGANIIEENFQVEDYVYQGFQELYKNGNIGLDDLKIVVAYARNYTVGQTIDEYNIYDNTIQAVDLFAYDIDAVGSLNLAIAINQLNGANQLDNIIDIYAVPSFALPTNAVTNATDFTYTANAIPSQALGKYVNANVVKPVSGTVFTDVKAMSNYTPVNNKLYTYPYCCLELSNPMGQKVQYAYEDLPSVEISGVDYAQFEIMSTITNPVQLTAYPRYYKRLGGSETKPLNSEAGISIANYPKCAFSGDAYKAWLAQNSVPMMIDTVMNIATGAVMGAVMGAGGGAAIGAVIGAGLGAVESGASVIASDVKAHKASDATRGSINNGNVMHSQGVNVFNVAMKHIPNQYAKIIDDYFSLYGYTVNELKMPSRSNRKHWTYVKTKSCNFGRRELPSDELAQIKSIYDRGVRFWNDGDKIGDYVTYLSDNTPV